MLGGQFSKVSVETWQERVTGPWTDAGAAIAAEDVGVGVGVLSDTSLQCKVDENNQILLVKILDLTL